MSVPAHPQAIERLGGFRYKRMAEATPSGRGLMDRMKRIYRIDEDLSHARLTLHAASALKTQSRQGRGIEESLPQMAQSTERKKGIIQSAVISVDQWLNIVFLFFRDFRAFRGSPS